MAATSKTTKPPRKRRPSEEARTREAQRAKPAEDVPGIVVLRNLAKTAYVTDQHGCSIDQLHKRPPFDTVHTATLYKWSTEDQWKIKRDEFNAGWQAQMQKRLGDHLIQTRINNMKLLQELYDKQMLRLKESAVQENSWEGVMAVLLRVLDKIEEYSEQIGIHVVTQADSTGAAVSGAPSIPAIRPKLSEQEAIDAARMIIKSRRDAMRAALAEKEKEAK